MALFKWLRRALTARGFIVTRVHPVDATRIASLIDRVADRGADGVTYRNAIDHWLYTDRPIVERLVGNTTALYIEGPVYVAGGTHYPLSAQLRVGHRWIDCFPHEAIELMNLHSKAIDSVSVDWAMQRPHRFSDHCPTRRRNIDDEAALDMIAAHARAQSPGNREQDAGDL